MLLDPRLVKATLHQIEPVLNEASAYFYGRLFTEDPRLRTLFPPAMDAQRDRMFLALTKVASSLDSPASVSGYLAGLGREHRKYGVSRGHYASMKTALIATIRKFTRDTWNIRVEAAWSAAFDIIADTMIKAAEADAETSPPWWIAEVVEHGLRAPDIAVLTLRPGMPLPFAAGQSISVQTARWPRIWRPYSIANAPRPDGTLRLHVRAVPGGWVSGALVRATRPGDTLLLGAAHGAMTLDPYPERPLLLVAGGTGLAPLKAIAEQALRSGRTRPVRLLAGARTAAELYDLADLRRMEASHPQFRVTPVVSADPGFEGPRGLVTEVLDETLRAGLTAEGAGGAGGAEHGIGDPESCDAYVAGPPEMVRRSIELLRRHGLAQGRIHHDLSGGGLTPAGSFPAGPSSVSGPQPAVPAADLVGGRR